MPCERRGNVWFEWFFTRMHARPCEARAHPTASINASGAVSTVGSRGMSRLAGGSSGDGGNGQRAIGLIDESIALQTFQRRLVPEMINASSAHGAVLTALARDNPKLSASLSVTVDACLAFPRVPRACPRDDVSLRREHAKRRGNYSGCKEPRRNERIEHSRRCYWRREYRRRRWRLMGAHQAPEQAETDAKTKAHQSEGGRGPPQVASKKENK